MNNSGDAAGGTPRNPYRRKEDKKANSRHRRGSLDVSTSTVLTSRSGRGHHHSNRSDVAMEWAVDSLRGSIRTLVRDRTRYGELMLEIAAFVRKPEEERLSAEENGRLVQRLAHKLQLDGEPKTRDAAISLCSQLVALEGLGKMLKDGSNSSTA